MLRFSRVFVQSTVRGNVRFLGTSQKLSDVAVDGGAPTMAPHIVDLVDKIGALTILEVSQLNTLMKERFGLSDVSMAAPMAAAPAAAPVAAPAAAAEPEEEEEEAPAVVQTEFTVKLKSYDAKAKIKIIKEMKSIISGINLVEAKKLVESAPCDVKKDLPKDEAEELKGKLEKAGAVIEIL